MGRLLWHAAVLTGTLGSAAWADDPFNRTIVKTTPAGQEVIVGSYTSWDKKCRVAPLPNISVTMAPQNGTTVTRPGTKIAQGSLGSTTCNGREFPATQLFYRPRAGFHGQDKLGYSVSYGANSVVASVTVTVE